MAHRPAILRKVGEKWFYRGISNVVEEITVTTNRQDVRLKWWAVAALILTAIFFLLRDSIAGVFNTPVDTYLYLKIAINVIMLGVVLGFYLRMLLECGFSRDVSRRGAWLFLLIVVPVLSAFIYYFVTRSVRYKSV